MPELCRVGPLVQNCRGLHFAHMFLGVSYVVTVTNIILTGQSHEIFNSVMLAKGHEVTATSEDDSGKE